MPLRVATRQHLDLELEDVERCLGDGAAGLAARLLAVSGRWADTDPCAVVDARPVMPATCEEVEQRTFQLLARQAPVGRDLRRIVSLTRCAARLDRAAALTRHVVEIRAHVDADGLPGEVLATTERLGALVAEQFDVAVRAWTDGDVGVAAELHDRDDEVDAVARQLQDADVFVDGIAVELGLLARHHERIGDHAVALSDEVLFVATGTRPDRRSSTTG